MLSQLLTWALLVICIALLAAHFTNIKDQGNGE
jgi:hypothetical protein